MTVIYIVLRRMLSRTSRTSIPVLVAALLAVMVLGAVAEFYSERGVNPQFHTLGDCFWWAIVTMSTVGYGDKVPVTALGRGFASGVMIAGPVLLASFAASVGVTFYDEWQKGIRGMVRIPHKKHVVLCTWSATAAQVLAELRISDWFVEVPVAIVDADVERNPSDDSKTSFVRGMPSEVAVLEQANIREAAYAVVTAKDRTPAADQQTVLTVLAIKALNPKVYVCAEVIDANNEGHLKRAGCNVVVNTRSLTGGLLALSLENPDTNEVIKELATFRGNQVYRVGMPEGMAGRKFGETLNDYKKTRQGIIVGIERDTKPVLNPASDLELRSSDHLLVMSEEYPG